MKRRVAAAVLAALLLSAGTAAAAVVWRISTSNATIAATLGAKINAEHYRVCGRSLTQLSSLNAAAEFKSYDMGFRGTMSHRFSDGAIIWDFYKFAGISFPYGAGEILAYNNFPDAQTVQVVFDGWMNSSGHRAIIQNCGYDRFGVAVFKTRGDNTSAACDRTTGGGCGKWFAAEFTNTSQP